MLNPLYKFTSDKQQSSNGLPRSADANRAELHLLVPATSSNIELCKLLLSIEILEYPTPILINYGDPEEADPYIQHVKKVEGLLNYIKAVQLRPNYRNDLVVIVDGYDVWFQLRPEVLLKRYFAINSAFDQHVATDMLENKVRQTIFFGPDKLCSPVDFGRPACWAVPQVPLQRYAFGPLTFAGPAESEFNMPQWLNSGTIMGPVDDLDRLLQATLDRIHNNFTINSDQLYFADIWGEQEMARTALQARPSTHTLPTRNPVSETRKNSLNVSAGPNEYHIGLDYRSAIFQTVAFYKDFLVWTRPAYYWMSGDANTEERRLDTYSQMSIPPDIASSPGPFSALSSEQAEQGASWADVDLCYNTATKEIPVLIHFTGEKQLRQDWWRNMWFQSRAKELRQASTGKTSASVRITPKPISGRMWFAAGPQNTEAFGTRGYGGTWINKGGWLSRGPLCAVHDKVIFDIGL